MRKAFYIFQTAFILSFLIPFNFAHAGKLREALERTHASEEIREAEIRKAAAQVIQKTWKRLKGESCPICLNQFRPGEEVIKFRHSGHVDEANSHGGRNEIEPFVCGHAFHPSCMAGCTHDACPMDRQKISTSTALVFERTLSTLQYLVRTVPGSCFRPVADQTGGAAGAPRAARAPVADQRPPIPQENWATRLRGNNEFEHIRDLIRFATPQPIQGGGFTMGSPPEEQGRLGILEPQHQVRVQNFRPMMTHISRGQWLQTVGQYPQDFRNCGLTQAEIDHWFDLVNLDKPMTCISWEDVNRLLLPKLQPNLAGVGFAARILSEEQAEYLARLTQDGQGALTISTTAYPWGDDPAQLNQHALYEANSNGEIQNVHVGPRIQGVFQTRGNVNSWTDSDFNRDSKIIRGGAGNASADRLRSAARDFLAPSARDKFLGVRLVLEPLNPPQGPHRRPPGLRTLTQLPSVRAVGNAAEN